MVEQAVIVDARGLRCPWPVLRLARAFRDGAHVVELLSDDPAAAGEVAAFATERGLTSVVRKDPAGSTSFLVGA